MHWLMIFHLIFLCYLLCPFCFAMTTHTKYNSSQGSCVGTALQQQILQYKLDCSVLCVTEQCTAYSLHEKTTSATIGYHCTLLSNVTGLQMRDDSHCFCKSKISLWLASMQLHNKQKLFELIYKACCFIFVSENASCGAGGGTRCISVVDFPGRPRRCRSTASCRW